MLLDDGFQHLPLHKDFTVVVEPRTANRRCLPAGPYREPRRRLRDADVVVPGEFEVKYHKMRFQSADGRAILVGGLAATPVTVLCAIGDPSRFRADLMEAGLQIADMCALRDHDKLDAGNLLSDLPPELPVVVTAKDWVKLRERQDVDLRQIVIAVQELELTPGEEFRQRLAAKLHEVDSQKS